MRLDKFISETAGITRSEAKKSIRSGNISVDGICVRSCDSHIDENTSAVTIGGKKLSYEKFIYLMMNKPKGYVCASCDNDHPTVIELLPAEYAKFSPSCVGRLDIDTEGLLLLTNDGEFTHNVITPKKNVYKKYFAVLDAAATEKDVDFFASGPAFKDFTAKPAHLEICEDPREVYIEIAEGKYHQVKRMCAKCGKNVTYLKRTAIGALSLDENLGSGQVRCLSEKEINLFKRYI